MGASVVAYWPGITEEQLNRNTRHWDTGPIVTSECNVDFHWPIR